MNAKQPNDDSHDDRSPDIIALLVFGLYFLIGTGVIVAGLASVLSVWLTLWLAIVCGLIVAVLGLICLFKNSDTLFNAAALWFWVIILGGILWPVGQKARYIKAEQSHHRVHPMSHRIGTSAAELHCCLLSSAQKTPRDGHDGSKASERDRGDVIKTAANKAI